MNDVKICSHASIGMGKNETFTDIIGLIMRSKSDWEQLSHSAILFALETGVSDAHKTLSRPPYKGGLISSSHVII